MTKVIRLLDALNVERAKVFSQDGFNGFTRGSQVASPLLIHDARKVSMVFLQDEKVHVRSTCGKCTYPRKSLRIVLNRELQDIARYRKFDIYLAEVTIGDRKKPCIVIVPAEN